nr:unnamed protein product [Digitaria exilis]
MGPSSDDGEVAGEELQLQVSNVLGVEVSNVLGVEVGAEVSAEVGDVLGAKGEDAGEVGRHLGRRRTKSKRFRRSGAGEVLQACQARGG